ncbi:TPA: hypothetical protein ACGVBQ_004247 [Vibrio vulnificus]|uniref:hypothetical protein n=1 Tax=Vibrio vulnificus TaxID=672 RepID=UPI001A2DF354|nr:hypothetical protein [Vibrio vulnificus]MCA0772126.1 hypothetical protein [Vibrio vulnificus]HAS6144996.1 hypothetical protein [Vibrio vulnificus]
MDKLSSDVSFYVVSPKKFTVMYIGTLGFYGFYWMYKNWSIYRAASGEKIWPIARAIFFIFFLHSLCSKVTQSESLSSQADLPKSLEWDATKYVLLSILGQISDRLSENEIALPYSFFVSLVLFPFMCQILYKIQLVINESQNDMFGDTNKKLSWLNYVWLSLGGALWLMVIFGGYLTIVGEI